MRTTRAVGVGSLLKLLGCRSKFGLLGENHHPRIGHLSIEDEGSTHAIDVFFHSLFENCKLAPQGLSTGMIFFKSVFQETFDGYLLIGDSVGNEAIGSGTRPMACMVLRN